MNLEQTMILAILAVTVGMFLWGKWRHDMVAAAALLACVAVGLIQPVDAFLGFGHNAVVTVACVLILSSALQSSGAVDVLTRFILPSKAGPTLSIAALTALAAILSGFMNNVGALALLMPVAIQIAGRLDLPAGKVLMPLAFGSILGGTTTLIGTPPNLIVSGFRESAGLGLFRMFDFTPTGVAVALVGVVFISLIGWRLVPARQKAGIEGFETEAYMTEARVPEESKLVGRSLRELDDEMDELDAQIVGLVRNEVRMMAPSAARVIRPNDILVIETDAESLADVLSTFGLELEEEEEAPTSDSDKETNDEIILQELAIMPSSILENRSASDLLLRTRYGINLLAVSRQGQRLMSRLRAIKLRPGDLLLLQGPPDALSSFGSNMGAVPLAERKVRIPDQRNVILSAGIMLGAVLLAASGWVSAAVAFAAGVLASMALRTVNLRSVYEQVDWPVIVLLAMLLPVAGVMQSTGAAGLVAGFLLDYFAQGNAVIALVVILLTTMILTDLMNNAATAAVLAPIALGVANQLDVNPDTFLMAVAIGASCAFLTPIGHQNNTLILGPGGFRFGDYWRMGLPLDLLVIATAIPMLLWVWPLNG
ncbi:TRAP transporter large permease subunit [Pusillimonas sp. DMV24BSW_D]|uniref:SLC13 family permease n=1 Tax=Neopusillimonas aestuarii TaxID=2716226 RepID=UPI00140C879A|nr:SLC13 family permease [Pusillimonas sp. DMV24BSW_D]QIM50039.1 TRAP transporter large permease subunit [Pusillimonas sp. DMV24BSW_D]